MSELIFTLSMSVHKRSLIHLEVDAHAIAQTKDTVHHKTLNDASLHPIG